MAGTVLLSTAYFPPACYLSLAAGSDEVRIEKWENYHKQTFRNRCTILGANGPLDLTVPVLRGSFHKTPIRDLKIDESRRWRDLHLRGILSAYSTAPYFEFYFETIKDVITGKHSYLLDLNMEALEKMLEIIRIDVRVSFTEEFKDEGMVEGDFRYLITPKKRVRRDLHKEARYQQVFSDRYGFIPGLSIIDMLLNNGPGTGALLQRSQD
ncbi:MAG: WbqC family protein [Bacteroidales bacterium]|nr:WbqC family protein [Bacteroidales bacterium]